MAESQFDRLPGGLVDCGTLSSANVAHQGPFVLLRAEYGRSLSKIEIAQIAMTAEDARLIGSALLEAADAASDYPIDETPLH